MYFSRSPEEIIKDRLLALSYYVGGFLRGLGFEVPAQDIEIESGKIMVRMKVKRLEKINNAFKKYIESKEIIEEKQKLPELFFNLENGELYRINTKGRKLIYRLRPNSLKYKILCFLANKKEFTPTSEIADEYNKSNKTIRSIISKLRNSIKKNLKIDGKKIIENVPSKGYRIKNIKIIGESSEDS